MTEKKCFCGIPYNKHERCEACLIHCGGQHLLGYSTKYRGHELCLDCKRSWEVKDNAFKRETTWKEFLQGTIAGSK